MSKGEIVSILGDGRYRVRQNLAVERITDEIEAIGARLAELAIKIPEKRLQLLQREAEADQVRASIENLISLYIQGRDGSKEELTKAQASLVQLLGQIRLLELDVAQLTAENLGLLKRRGQLQRIPEGKELEAWCADYSPELTGEVGLIDINDEGGKGVLIQPGYQGAAAYSAGRDGALFPRLAQSGLQVYLNAALLPGVQKWMPGYRLGTLTRLSLDAATVQLDPAFSSAQNLPINQSETLQDVPIVYMDCNAAAFEEGDRVVVRFTRLGPLIIGFESNPKACSAKIICTPIKSLGVWDAEFYGFPFDDDGAEINPPLGTPNTPYTGAWIFSKFPGNYLRGATQDYGLRNWIGKNPSDVVSWHGPASRICSLAHEFEGAMWQLYSSWHPGFGSVVFHKGVEICDLQSMNINPDFTVVDGAAIVYSSDKKHRWLRVCASNLKVGVYNNWQDADDRYGCYIIDIPWDGLEPDLSAFEIIATYASEYLIPPSQGMYFSASGNQAVMCFSRQTHSVLALHWSPAGGFTEDPIYRWEDGDEGTVTLTRGGSFEQLTETEHYESYRPAGHEKIIGYDFEGESLQPVRLVFGESSYTSFSSITRNNPLQGVYWEPNNEYYVYMYKRTSVVSSSQSSSRTDPTQLIYGNRLLLAPERGVQIDSSSEFTTSGTDYVGYISGSGSETFSEDGFSYSSLLIDPRFGLVACEYRSIDGSEQSLGAGTEQTTNGASTTRTSYRLYRYNEVLHQIETEPVANQWSTSVTQDPFGEGSNDWPNGPPPINGYHTVSPWAPTRAARDTFRINNINSALNKGVRVQQGGLVSNGVDIAASIEWFHESGPNEYELYRFTYFDGVTNPVQSIMQRDPDDGYMFANFGLY